MAQDKAECYTSPRLSISGALSGILQCKIIIMDDYFWCYFLDQTGVDTGYIAV